jgi:hypothetical protein
MGKYFPGQSGNPGGRAKVVQAELEKFRGEKDLRDVRNALLKIALDDSGLTETKDRIAAIKEWHDRAYGRPAQAITGEDGGPIAVDNSSGLLEALKRLAEVKQ